MLCHYMLYMLHPIRRLIKKFDIKQEPSDIWDTSWWCIIFKKCFQNTFLIIELQLTQTLFTETNTSHSQIDTNSLFAKKTNKQTNNKKRDPYSMLQFYNTILSTKLIWGKNFICYIFLCPDAAFNNNNKKNMSQKGSSLKITLFNLSTYLKVNYRRRRSV